MHLSSVLLAALTGSAALVSAKGFVVPANQEDGVYSFDINTGEVYNFIPLQNISSVATPLKARKTRRAVAFPDGYKKGCTEAYTPGNKDEHDAWQAVVDYCENSGSEPIRWRSGHYASRGGIVWYVCNYDSLNNQGCNRVEMDEAGGVLAGACPGRGGWIAIDAWNKMYGRDGAGREICNGIPMGT